MIKPTYHHVDPDGRIMSAYDLLAAAHDLQKIVADDYIKTRSMTHGPEIGNIYEGITNNILKVAIPELSIKALKLVTGFIVNDNGKQSPQIDAMLVTGDPEPIPFSTSNAVQVHIRDVVAVLEVKKTLLKEDFEDAYNRMRAITKCFNEWFSQPSAHNATVDIGSAIAAIARATGRVFESRDDAYKHSDQSGNIYDFYAMECGSPLRIIYGFDGYANEFTLRQGFRRHLEKQVGLPWNSVGILPSLVGCGRQSIIKVNGQPYEAVVPKHGPFDVAVSMRGDISHPLLKMIRHRLHIMFELPEPSNLSLMDEGLHTFLKVEVAERYNKVKFWYYPITLAKLKKLKPEPWEPMPLAPVEARFIYSLQPQSEFNPSNNTYIGWCKENNVDPDEFISNLVHRGTFAYGREKVYLIPRRFVFDADNDGCFYIVTDMPRFSLWLSSRGKTSLDIKTKNRVLKGNEPLVGIQWSRYDRSDETRDV